MTIKNWVILFSTTQIDNNRYTYLGSWISGVFPPDT